MKEIRVVSDSTCQVVLYSPDGLEQETDKIAHDIASDWEQAGLEVVTVESPHLPPEGEQDWQSKVYLDGEYVIGTS
ncbi:hypothetical protein HY468_02515 [Candidatus Roizmanbacteria bacterium]|nr:hypothetical protein [Candidatus Roizmanbacteria bacterium]